MQHQKLIKKIFRLAWYDWNSNIDHWFSMTGIHAAIITGLFAVFTYFFLDYNVLSPVYHTSWVMMGIGMSSLILWLLNFVMQQNALDLAFDSMMSGYNAVRMLYRPLVNWLFIVRNFFLFGVKIICIISLLYCMFVIKNQYQEIHGMWMLIALGCLLLLCYLLQGICFLSMHSIEYKECLLTSSKVIIPMIWDNLYLLCHIMVLEICIIIGFSMLLWYLFTSIMQIVLPFFLWIFTIFALPIGPLFIMMLSTFFYIWSWMMLYGWMMIFIAHVYRQLICPPVENAACSSCSSCR